MPSFLPPVGPLVEVSDIQAFLSLHEGLHVHHVAVAGGDDLVDDEVIRRRDPDFRVEDRHRFPPFERRLVKWGIAKREVKMPRALLRDPRLWRTRASRPCAGTCSFRAPG